MSLLRSPKLIRAENRFILLLDRTMERAFALRTMDYERELVRNVRREFGSRTYVKQLDNIITEIIKQSLLYADNQMKQISAAAIEESYVLTEEAGTIHYRCLRCPSALRKPSHRLIRRIDHSA